MDKSNTPPKNTLHVNRWTDLPDTNAPARYYFIKDDKRYEFTASNKLRVVLEGLMKQPIACASKCRISQYVSNLKRDHGVDIETVMYSAQNPTPQGGESFGVYFLHTKIERVSDIESEAA